MDTTIVYWGYIGIMEKKMETTIVYWGYIGIMEKNMETTICESGQCLIEQGGPGLARGLEGFPFFVRLHQARVI